MDLQTNNARKPFDLNRFWELYEKASEARSQLLKERHELAMENIELRMQLRELRAQVSPIKPTQKPKGLLIRLNQ